MWALTVAAIYVIPFLLLGYAGKRLADRWMDRKGLDLSGGVRAQLGPSRGRRWVFLLGAWRAERDDGG